MASRVCLVHYHEIGLKGNNRARFERILMDNIKAALAAFSVATITRISGHILVTFSVSGEAERAFPLIAKVPGVRRHRRHPYQLPRRGVDQTVLPHGRRGPRARHGPAAKSFRHQQHMDGIRHA